MCRDNLKFVFVTILSGVVLSEGQLNRPILRVPDINELCEPITEVDICANVGYNKTTFPNYRNQRNQQEARDEIMGFSPLIQAGCSNALVHLLCAVYVPFCVDIFDRQMRIPPCRELCEYVRGGCEPTLVTRGFMWPQHLNCSLYPSKGTLCFGPDDLTMLQPADNVSTSAPPELLPSFEVTVLGPTAVEFSWKPPASSPQMNSSYNSTLSCYTKLNQAHNQMVLTQEYSSEDTGMTVVQLDGFRPSTTYTCNVTIFSTIQIELSVQASANFTTLSPLELLPSCEVTVLGPTAVEFSWKPPASSPQEVNSSYNSTLSCYTKLNQAHNKMVLTQEYSSEDTGMTVVQLDGFRPSTTYICNVTIFSTIQTELSVQASANFTTLSPLQVQFISNTPVVKGANIHAQFIISRPATHVTCNLLPGASDKVNCSNGSITFNNISPGEYVVRVKAQNSKHDEGALRRKVAVIGGSTLCGTHLINKGITQTGRNVTVEFTGTGPRAGFTCRLDKEKRFSCSSPVVLAGLQAGEHQLKITPNGCEKSTKAKFSV